MRQVIHEGVQQKSFVVQRVIPAASLYELADLTPDRLKHLQQVVVRFQDFMAEKLEATENLIS
jgi:hypothetical protein